MDETALEFEGPSFTDADLKALPNLEKVEMLTLIDTGVTDDGCRELLRARALVEIAIISDKIADDALGVLAQLPALRSLQIHRGPRIGDEGLRYLSGCVGLRELYLKHTAITDRGLSAIHKLPQVWSLILDDTMVSDEGCAALAEMQQLSLLSLKRTRGAGHGVAKLRDNEHFNVYLEGTPATDDGVIAIAERISNLKLISVIRTTVGDRAARALAKLQRLDDVRFSHTKLTDEGLAAFSRHPFLEVIYVEGCVVSKAAVSALKKDCRKLTVYGP
jgi:internalin A